MEEMRVQIEAREPTDGEIRAFWFTLPIDTEQVEELLGIDVDTDYYYIRVLQRDHQWAWSSPIWVERT